MDGGPSGDSPPPSMMTSTENLLPTLLQIFLTVTLGWLAGSLGMFGRREARGREWVHSMGGELPHLEGS